MHVTAVKLVSELQKPLTNGGRGMGGGEAQPYFSFLDISK